MRKSRFFSVSKGDEEFFLSCFLEKIPVLEFNFQVFVLKLQYGLFSFL